VLGVLVKVFQHTRDVVPNNERKEPDRGRKEGRKIGRKKGREGGREEARKQARKEGRKEGRKETGQLVRRPTLPVLRATATVRKNKFNKKYQYMKNAFRKK
jgi:flagellar biosynthesis/type III secretory pathway protein FliH